VREEKGREMAEIGRLREKVSWVGGGCCLKEVNGDRYGGDEDGKLVEDFCSVREVSTRFEGYHGLEGGGGVCEDTWG
jgi:hypothetical protein